MKISDFIFQYQSRQRFISDEICRVRTFITLGTIWRLLMQNSPQNYEELKNNKSLIRALINNLNELQKVTKSHFTHS